DLEAGPHTLSLEVVTAYPDIIRQMQQVQLELNAFYRQILMIVGSDPDPYRDYMLTGAIPGFKEQLQGYHATLETLLDVLYANGFEKGGEVVTVVELADQIHDFIEDPDKVPAQLSNLKDSLAALGNWMLTLTQQPLELDYLGILPADSEPLKNTENFFTNFAYGVKVFLASFVADYTTLDEGGSASALEVWANVGRDQAQIIKRLVDNDFEDRYPIDVTFNLVQQALIPATLSGKGPDVAIMVSPTDVINLAVRDALVSLNSFTGGEDVASLEEVKTWFHPASTQLYSYEGETYGLPVDEQFFMMFYRRDVLAELELAVPTTWEEMNNVISVLAHNYLSVGIPSGANEVMFQTLLMQYGGSYYTDGWRHTGLTSDRAVAAFRQWTEFFTKYSLPVEYDPYSRFRSGEMPIVINYYTFYNQLYSSAPEIKGLWEMAPIPGVVQADGTVNQTSMGTGTAVVMFRKAADTQAAWTFMQWLVSSKTQSDYAQEVESILGVAGRYNTANVEAFRNIAWKKATEQEILAQWDQMQIVQMTPVSYYYTRNVTNAFRKVVYASVNPREALGSYARDIEKEIRRKREMFGLD
ncbi:MAG: extracellular solute-binding protein, partial [Clostridia bacterium]|nr:extracellular solute-binding protein [Clostridia bacterium]